MSGNSQKISRSDSARKARPTVQLYRPGMLRAATDSNRTLNREKSTIERPSRALDTGKGYGNDKENGEKRESRSRRARCKEFISDTLWNDYADDERAFILNKNDYASLNGRSWNRRRGSQGSSSNGTYRVEMNSNGSSRGSINRSCDHLAGNSDSGRKRPGKRMYSNSTNYYSSSQSLCEGSSAQNRDYHYTGHESWRFGSKTSLRDRSRTSGQESEYQDNSNVRSEGYSSSASFRRQQLSLQRNDRGDGDARRSPNKFRPLRSTTSDRSTYIERNSSRRAGFQRDDAFDRQRNWSFRSNQSERFENRQYRSNKGSSADRASSAFQDGSQVNDVDRKDSATEKPGTSSKHMSFQDLCASLDSIDLASFDWSSEVEAEERRKKEREELERMKAMRSQRTNPHGPAKEGSIRGGSGLPSKSQNRSDSGCFGRLYSSNDQESSVGRGHRFTSHRLTGQRRRNDSFTSQTSSIAESIEEQSDVDGGGGDKTPTNEQVATSAEEQKNKGKSYLDEELPIIVRGHGQGSAVTHRSSMTSYRGGIDDRGRYKRGSRWRTRKQQNPRVRETAMNNTMAAHSGACDGGRNSNGDSSATSAVPTAMLPAVARGSTLITPPVAASLRQERSEISTPFVEAKTSVADVLAESVFKKMNKSNRNRPELPPTEWPIHLEISSKEGPQIQELNDTLNLLIDRITESADLSAGEEILAVSKSLSKLYLSIVTRDINYTYTMNLEQHLWKQCFYTSIEALRAASNSTGNASRIFRSSLSELIQQGLAFYAQLLNKYEVSFGFIIDDYLYWQAGLPADDFVGCVLIDSGPHEASDHIIKVALLSVQRLAVSVGDLHRYSAIVSGMKDYSQARLWYQKAAQLAPGNGRSYNQLALLAVYSIVQRSPMRSARDVAFVRIGSFIRANKCKLQSKWIDVIFYYIRALAARYPFETARQPLFTAFNHVQKRVSDFEVEFNACVGDSATREAEAAAARADRPHEIWIAQDGKLSSGDYANIVDHRAVHMLDLVSAVELFRRAVPYVLHTAGLLITKIGMEEYESISERALFHLSQLISRDECPVSSVHLVQLSVLFLYAVHSLSLKSAEPGTCSLQQQQAVQMVLSLFGVVLRPLHDHLADLLEILDGSTPLPSKVRRVLPAVFVISEWLSMPSVNRLYGSMPSLESIETSLIQIDTWQILADIANALVSAESKGFLSRTLTQSDIRSEEYSEIVLPESVFLASFIDVFTVLPKSLRMSLLPNTDLRNNSSLLALHARLSSLLSTAEYLDGSELHCFGFDEHLRRFAASRSISPENAQNAETIKHGGNLDREYSLEQKEIGAAEHDTGLLSDEHQHYRQAVRENQMKQELLERETKNNRVVIEVRPQYLVPDTNTFIDHLESIKRIVESRWFTVLVPTTVLWELVGLSQPPPSSSTVAVGAQDDLQDNWVCERAKEAVTYLRGVADRKLPQIYTVTSKGNRLSSLSFAAEENCASRKEKTVNDDFILSSCVALIATLPIPPSATAAARTGSGQSPRLYRSVVLLTEDRALNIKAVCANVPCRTVPSFMKWAAFK